MKPLIPGSFVPSTSLVVVKKFSWGSTASAPGMATCKGEVRLDQLRFTFAYLKSENSRLQLAPLRAGLESIVVTIRDESLKWNMGAKEDAFLQELHPDPLQARLVFADLEADLLKLAKLLGEKK